VRSARRSRQAASSTSASRVGVTPVEVVDVVAHVLLATHVVDVLLELGVLDPQAQSRRTESRELLGVDLAPDPPVRVVVVAEALERLAGAGQVIELAPPDRLLDRGLDVQRALVRRR
jgi:hypothetical protein